MDNLTSITKNAIDNYFVTVAKTGYVNYNIVGKILIVSFIEELLDNFDLSYYIDEDDYKVISNTLYCLYDNCSISYPEYNDYIQLINESKHKDYFRVEDNSLRFTEDSFFRTIAKTEVKDTYIPSEESCETLKEDIIEKEEDNEDTKEYMVINYVESKKVPI